MEEKIESQNLIPIEKIRELMLSNPSLGQSDDVFNNNLDASFNNYVNSDDEDKKEEVKKHNKRKFKLFRKGKEKKETDQIATSVYQSRYDRETWYYKRHKDTIDKYVKKDEKDGKKQECDVKILRVETEEDDTLRIGFLKMWFIVMFDFLISTCIGNIIASPIHIFKVIAETFTRMKKAVSITVAIITILIIVIVGLILGVNYVFSLVQGLS